RRRDCNGVRTVWVEVRHLRGRGGRTSPGSECLSNAVAWRGGKNRQRRDAHPEGRDQRGDARLGDKCASYLLLAGQCARTASVSADGARVSERNRARSARTKDRKSVV